MDAMECLLGRRSIRSFTDRKIEREDLEKIVKAAYHAPSAMNRQSSRFIVIRKADVIEELAECLRKKLNRDSGYNFYKPNALILCTAPALNTNGVEDCAVAMENIMLAAHSLGIGSVWINQFKGVCNDVDVRSLLRRVDVPDSYVVCGCAALGYAADDALRNYEKNPNVVSWIE